LSSIKPYTYSHSIQGAQVKPLTEDGKQVSILYNGPLTRSNAGQIFLHCGFGDKNSWTEIIDHPMEQVNSGWEKTIRVEKGKHLNFFFNDGWDNWDNNNGTNWAYRISG